MIKITSKQIDIALFVVALILLNVVISGAHIRGDVTRQKTYTISEASRKTISTLSEPLSIKVFFSKNLPTTYKSVSQYVKDILFEYEKVGGKKFSYSIFDMTKPENEKIARSFGCNQVQVQQLQNNEAKTMVIWLSVAIVYGDAVQAINGITSTDRFEYNLTTQIAKLASTISAVGALADNDKVQVTLYKTAELDNFGIAGLSDIKAELQKATDELNKKYLGKLQLLDAGDTKTVAGDEADKYGLQSFNWENKDGSEGRGVFGVVLKYGENFRTVPITIVRGLFGYGVAGTDELNDNIDKSMQSLFAVNTRTIGYLLGHNEVETFDEKGNQTRFTKMLSDMYTFKDLNLDANEVPGDIDCVMINGPKTTLLDSELYKLDQFIMKGGNLIIFADPFEMKQDNPYTPTQFNTIDTGLNKILSTYGVTLSNALVFDENCFKARQASRAGGVEEFLLYWAPMLSNRELLQSHPITRNLGYVIYLQPGLLALKDWQNPTLGSKKIEDVKMTVLAVTSKAAWTQEKNIQLTPNMGAPYDKSIEKSKPLAVLLEGRFNSAFTKEVETKTQELDKDRAESSTNASDKTLTTRTHLKKSIAPGKIFVAPSSFVVGDQIIDEEGSEPVAIMMRNVVDYMNGNEELCTMRTKGASFQTLRIYNGPFVTAVTWFCVVGLAIITLIIGLIVWQKRQAHRRDILAKFNPNDTRIITR